MKTLRRLASTIATAGTRWMGDRCGTMAAALAFFAAFSLAPMLVVVIAVGGFFYGADAVEGKLFGELQGLIGAQGATAVQAMLSSAWKADGTGVKTALSVLTILVGASATFSELRDDLNAIWCVQRPGGVRALTVMLRARLKAIGLVMGVGFLLVVSLVVDAALSALESTIWRGDPPVKLVAETLHQGTSLVLLAVAFAALLKYLPQTPIRWRQVWLGAGAAALLFVIGRRFFGMYLSHAGTVDAFGAAGSLAVILMWLYYSAAVFLFGAQVAHAWSSPATARAVPPARADAHIAGASPVVEPADGA